ncbi:hypothetical protein F2Q69_00034983 [Brassica cretica]|uniref:Uncharacterized protein n=1 Tax=Brassica cretica TaxID=69181 RepID=A0A8S9SJ80_BRACR|nr:hypothetical protein F2Q69_00034983 [Brassica cretica]
MKMGQIHSLSLRSDRPRGLIGCYVATGSFSGRSLRSDRLFAGRSLRGDLTDRKYIQALSTRDFDGPCYEPTSYSKFNKKLDTMSELNQSKVGLIRRDRHVGHVIWIVLVRLRRYCLSEYSSGEAKQTDGNSYLTVTGFVNCRVVIRQLQRQLLSSFRTVARSYFADQKGKGSDTEHRERKKLMETEIAGKDRSGSDPTVLKLRDGVFGVSYFADQKGKGSDTEHRERKKLMETEIAGKDRSGSDPTVLKLRDGVFGVSRERCASRGKGTAGLICNDIVV